MEQSMQVLAWKKGSSRENEETLIKLNKQKNMQKNESRFFKVAFFCGIVLFIFIQSASLYEMEFMFGTMIFGWMQLPMIRNVASG